MKRIITLLVILLHGVIVAQQDFAINNVRLFDGENVQQRVSVLIEDGKIAKIQKQAFQHKNRINGEGKTLLPAMTNAHVHVWSGVSLQEAAQAGVLNLLDMHAMEALMPQMKGFNSSNQHANYYAAGSAATVPEGHGTQYGFKAPTLTKPEEAKIFVENRIKAGADYIKIIKEPWKATLNDATVKALIKEAQAQNKLAVVHVSKVKDGYTTLKNKANGLVHIWDDASLTTEQLASLKEENFFIIPTMLTIEKIQKVYAKKTAEEAKEKLKQLQNEVKRLYDIGVPILAGTDPPNANINYGTDLFIEMQYLQEAGIATIDVLKAATSLPAIHFKLKNAGFIKVGINADMVLVDGNPTKDINEIKNKKRVWKRGEEVKKM